MLGDSYPAGSVFLSILWFFLFIMWFMILFQVIVDVFRSKDMGGWAKAAWLVFVFVLPFLGVFVYLIARGGKMAEHRAQDFQAQDAAARDYIRDAAGTAASPADEISRLHDLKEKGAITDAEFEAAKAKALS
jgi:energy-coupling factor transporter transmembrane protein EcfT